MRTATRAIYGSDFKYLLVGDCCGATDPGNVAAAIRLVELRLCVFGTLAWSGGLVDWLRALR